MEVKTAKAKQDFFFFNYNFPLTQQIQIQILASDLNVCPEGVQLNL